MNAKAPRKIQLDDTKLLTLYGSSVSELLSLKCGDVKAVKSRIKAEPAFLSLKVSVKGDS